MEILETTDYSKFSYIHGNRNVDESHVNQLVGAIKETNLYKPLYVTPSLQILEGQHTLSALEILKLPVYYIVVPERTRATSLRDIGLLNTKTKPWTAKDFLNNYVSQNLPAYVIFKRFMSDFGYSLAVTQVIFFHQTIYGEKVNRSVVFRDGLMSISEKQKEQIWNVGKMIQQMKDTTLGCDGIIGTKKSIAALLDIFHRSKFSITHFLQKLEERPNTLHYEESLEAYLFQYLSIYNYKTPRIERI